MKKATNESIRIAGYVSQFLNEYAPSQKTNSINTLRSYQNALWLYLTFLENEKKVQCTDLAGDCFTRIVMEEWIRWLKEKRGCSPESCNNRLASIRVFLKFLGSRDVAYLYLYQEATGIPRQKCIKKKVSGLTREAVKVLMESPDPSSKTGRRDMAFMILLYGTAAQLALACWYSSKLHVSPNQIRMCPPCWMFRPCPAEAGWIRATGIFPAFQSLMSLLLLMSRTGIFNFVLLPKMSPRFYISSVSAKYRLRNIYRKLNKIKRYRYIKCTKNRTYEYKYVL